MPDLKPTLDGMVQGIISIRTVNGKELHTLQCQDCGDTEEPARLVLMKFKFSRCRNDPEPQRRCPTCIKIHIAQCDDELHQRR